MSGDALPPMPTMPWLGYDEDRGDLHGFGFAEMKAYARAAIAALTADAAPVGVGKKGLPTYALIDSLQTTDALRALCKVLRDDLAALAPDAANEKAVLSSHDSSEGRELPQWAVALRNEAERSAMKTGFTLSRDEVLTLTGSKFARPQPEDRKDG